MKFSICPIRASVLAASLAMAGCVAPVPTGTSQPETDLVQADRASLNLAIANGQQTQTLPREIDSYQISVKVGNNAPVTRTVQRQVGDFSTTMVGFPGLPAGTAIVKVEAYMGTTKVGAGDGGVNLSIGARSFVTIKVALNMAGNTEWMPAAPLSFTPMASASTLEGRFLFNLPSAYLPQLMLLPNSAGNPGIALTAGLKFSSYSYGTYAKLPATASANASGYFGFSDLADGYYQVIYDDATELNDISFNTAAVAVGSPVYVSAAQSAPPFAALDLGWDFFQAYPTPNQSVATGSVRFKWPPKSGYITSSTQYQVTVYPTRAMTGALASSAWSTETGATMSIPAEYAGSTRYYVVKYAQYGSFGSNSYYGQTRPIPFTVQ